MILINTKLKIIENPDKEIVREIRERLKETGNFCPCSIVRDNEDFKCMCKEFREQDIEGECYCGLYLKKTVEKED